MCSEHLPSLDVRVSSTPSIGTEAFALDTKLNVRNIFSVSVRVICIKDYHLIGKVLLRKALVTGFVTRVRDVARGICDFDCLLVRVTRDCGNQVTIEFVGTVAVHTDEVSWIILEAGKRVGLDQVRACIHHGQVSVLILKAEDTFFCSFIRGPWAFH